MNGDRPARRRDALARMGLGAARYRLTGHRMPLSAALIVTTRCDASCAYCALPMRPAVELDTAAWLAVVDELAGAGCVRVGITGGEPLVRQDLDAIVARAAGCGMWVTLETNGHRWPERSAGLRGVRRVVLSLDGTPAVHDEVREVGSHTKVLRAIEVARGDGVEVRTVTVLHRKNLQDVGYVLDLADRHGFAASFQVLHASGGLASRRAGRLVADDAALRKVLRELLEARIAGRPVGTSEKYLRFLLTWPDYAAPTSSLPHEDHLCMAGQLYCAIDTDGGVYACHARLGAPAMGNVRNGGFAEAFKRLRDNACRACTSTACTEHNFLYNLNGPRVAELAAPLRRLVGGDS